MTRTASIALLWLLGLSAGSALARSPSTRVQDREALKRALVEVMKRQPLKNARSSVFIQSLDDGQVVFAQNPDELLNPASNVKMVTAAAALSRLGPEYRYETEFLTDGDPRKGTTKHLYVRGKGDPSITTEKLYGVVSELLHAGLKEVTGDIVIDDTYFDGERLAPGYDQEDSDRSYMAPSGAVPLNWNAVGVYMRPGSGVGAKGVVEIEPPSDYFVVDNRLTTGTKRSRRFSVSSEPERDGQKQRITVRGQVPNERGAWSVWKKIDNPPLYFGHTLKSMLAARGVKVKGKVRLAPLPSTARMLYVAQSDTFDLVLKRLNKHSSNFVAGQLIKTLGAELKGPPGSFAKGIEAVEEFLEKEVGLPRGSYVMKNGSGLNDTNRFSAAQLSKVLKAMYERFPLTPEYLSSVGIAGKDGTLKYRFEGSEAVGRLRAKTGTLENVSALCGYVQAVGGERFVFTVLVNDFPGRAGSVVQHIDALGAAVAATGSLQGPDVAVAALTTPAAVSSPMDEVKARVRTYLALGSQGDKRNIPFLRTAWRAEKDPALRAVLAESLYQSDPDDYLGARALLDSFLPTDEVYRRLREVAKALSVDVPGVASVVELAAAGNLEAIGRLIELSRVGARDEGAAAELADALAEVARIAPDEMLLSLHQSSETDREVALSLLATGIVKSADAEHPFWPALRKSRGSVDPQVAAFAKQVESALSLKIADAKAPKLPEETQVKMSPPPAPPTTERPGG